MASIEYCLGKVDVLKELYPRPELANQPVKNWQNNDVYLRRYTDVIRHYTENSLHADGFETFVASVQEKNGDYHIRIESDQPQERLSRFAERHALLFGPDAGQKAIAGKRLLEELGVWNPMAGYPVNDSASDGDCKWALFPPLGLNVIGQRGILLMHYPPWQVLQQATFLEVMTMHRWNTVLLAAGVPKDEARCYRTFVDVNPIAAPGSGQAEYPNDYVPIMMASGFFHGPPERDYIRSMLELYLSPPDGGGSRYTLPLLICGSAAYDPQAPGWFRVTYKDQLPRNQNGTPDIDVLQAGSIRIRPDSARETPYLGANHMIAAGVTGRCGGDPAKLPNILKYEAQDLTAASFLLEYASNPDANPHEVKAKVCRRWFGNDDGCGAPKPPDPKDRQILCALAQMDLFFCATPLPHPMYNFDEAMQRCANAKNDDNPCAPPIGPKPSCDDE